MKRSSKLILILGSLFLSLCGCNNKNQEVDKEEPPYYTIEFTYGDSLVVPSDDSSPWFVSLLWENDQHIHFVISYQDFMVKFSKTIDECLYVLGNKEEIVPDGNFRDLYYCYRFGVLKKAYSISSNGTIFQVKDNSYYYIPKDIIDGSTIIDYIDDNHQYFYGQDSSLLKLYYGKELTYEEWLNLRKDNFEDDEGNS